MGVACASGAPEGVRRAKKGRERSGQMTLEFGFRLAIRFLVNRSRDRLMALH
jgi:hypothetical protein